jgi:hypothetical protein
MGQVGQIEHRDKDREDMMNTHLDQRYIYPQTLSDPSIVTSP